EDEPGQPLRLCLAERDCPLCAAALVPDAEAHVPLGLDAPEVARDAEGFASVGLELLVGPKEFDELPSLRRRAPRAVMERRLDRSAAVRAVAHLATPLEPRLQPRSAAVKRRVPVPGTGTRLEGASPLRDLGLG